MTTPWILLIVLLAFLAGFGIGFAICAVRILEGRNL
jgi:hypothetical protein